MLKIKDPWGALVAIVVFFALIAIAGSASGYGKYVEPLWNTVWTLIIIIVVAAVLKLLLFRE